MKTKTKMNANARKSKTKSDGLPNFRTGEEFDALSALEKQRVSHYFENRPLSASERAEIRSLKKPMGRPRVGKGAKVISLSVERDLLDRADAYAREHGIKRAELVAKGLLAVIGP